VPIKPLWHLSAAASTAGGSGSLLIPELEGGGPTRAFIWRRERDSNPRYADAYTDFRDRRLQPLSHLSELINYNNRTTRFGWLFQMNLAEFIFRIRNYALADMLTPENSKLYD
jgi:hypothetical protein